jgi:hypothetical protein
MAIHAWVKEEAINNKLAEEVEQEVKGVKRRLNALEMESTTRTGQAADTEARDTVVEATEKLDMISGRFETIASHVTAAQGYVKRMKL